MYGPELRGVGQVGQVGEVGQVGNAISGGQASSSRRTDCCLLPDAVPAGFAAVLAGVAHGDLAGLATEGRRGGGAKEGSEKCGAATTVKHSPNQSRPI